MNDELYLRFSTALGALPEADLLGALGRVEHAIEQACRTAKADAIFMAVGESGRPGDNILRVFSGRRVGEIAQLWAQLRGELADELARTGAPEDVVAELRGGGPQPDDDERHQGPPLLMAPANDVVAEPDV